MIYHGLPTPGIPIYGTPLFAFPMEDEGLLPRSDTFNRTDGAIGTPSDGGSDWIVWSGIWSVDDNELTQHSTTVAAAAVVLECETSAVRVRVDIRSVPIDAGIILRGVDSSNYMLLRYDSTQIRIQKIATSTITTLATLATTVSNGDEIEFYANEDDDLIGLLNGVPVISVNDSTHNTATLIGLWTDSNTDQDLFDNFNSDGEFGVDVEPGVEDLVLATYAPTVLVHPTTITPSTKALTTTLYAPSVMVIPANTIVVIPGLRTLTLSPYAPTVSVQMGEPVGSGTGWLLYL